MFKPTVIFIMVMIGAITCYDVWAFAYHGYDATISHAIYTVSAGWPIVPFIFGVFAGHLFFANH